MTKKISAFVVSYNREKIIGTCLKALQFADEVILVDKSSTDATVEIAESLVNFIKIVPWSPTVEGTRSYAESLCTHEWILFLDDDECLNIEAIKFIQNELKSPRALIYSFPLKHYICGIHSEDAYYWPEHHIRLYKKGAIKFGDSVHGSIVPQTEDIYKIPPESGIFIHHFSYQNVAEWFEKANRYTSQLDRVRMIDAGAGSSIIRYAHRAIDRWVDLKPIEDEAGYEAMVAVMRASYDIMDRLKSWSEFKISNADTFSSECAILEDKFTEYYGTPNSSLLLNPRLKIEGSANDQLDQSKLSNSHKNLDDEKNSLYLMEKAFDVERSEAGIKVSQLELINHSLSDQVSDLLKRLKVLSDLYDDDTARLKDYCLDLEKSCAREIALNHEIQITYQNSFSWKITAPIRKLSNLFKRNN